MRDDKKDKRIGSGENTPPFVPVCTVPRVDRARPWKHNAIPVSEIPGMKELYRGDKRLSRSK